MNAVQTSQSCERCGTPRPEFLSVTGEKLCRPCFSNDQVKAYDARAQATARNDVATQLVGDTTFASPAKLMMLGGAVMLGSIAGAVAVMLVTGRLFFLFGFVFLSGFVMFARGFAKRFQR